MKFLIDAQLPRRLAHRLRQEGFEVIHTLDLPLRNRTPDSVINELSVRDQYIVVTKDEIFLASLVEIETGFQRFDFLEITRKAVISHV